MCSGEFSLRILKFSPTFETSSYELNSQELYTGAKFSIAKRTRFFIEQTIRERLQAKIINSTFHHGFLRLRLSAALRKKIVYKIDDNTIQINFTFQTLLMGLGPKSIIKISTTNILNGPRTRNLYFTCKHRNVTMHPCILELPNAENKILMHVTSTITFHEEINTKLKLFLCSNTLLRPLAVATIILPFVEDTS